MPARKHTKAHKPLFAEDSYREICAHWLAHLLTQSVRTPREINRVLQDRDCQELLAIPLDENDEPPASKSPRLFLKGHLRSLLENSPPPLAETTLGRNIEFLAEEIGLEEAEKKLLGIATLANHYDMFNRSIPEVSMVVSKQTAIKQVSAMLGISSMHAEEALRPDGILMQSGLLRLTVGIGLFNNIFEIPHAFSTILFTPCLNKSELLSKFLKIASPAKLSEQDFPHLSKEIDLMRRYLGAAVTNGEKGINILIHGKPGVGKTELAKLIAQDINASLYEAACEDEEGDSSSSRQRLASYMLSQRLLSKNRGSIIMFDEVEDIFPASLGGLLFLLSGNNKEHAAGKAWVNRTLEANPVPAIWIANYICQIDPAYLRRFDYVLEMRQPPKTVRRRIVDKYLGDLKIAEPFADRLAEWRDISPALLEKAARVARLNQPLSADEAQAITEKVLRGSAQALDLSQPPTRAGMETPYSLGYLNADMNTQAVIESLKRRPRGTFLFHGPPGTGKTALARHIADAIDKPMMVRRASDLLSMWVGESEKNIARMFREAVDEDAVLVLDEADSLLADRRGAQQSWEVTQVNEMLTHMEDFQGIFICTTNLLEKLDAASLRRFAFKVRFGYLDAPQRREFFLAFWKKLNPAASELNKHALLRLDRMNILTPGDFAAVARRQEIIGTLPSAEELLDALDEECQVKGISGQPMGFLA